MKVCIYGAGAIGGFIGTRLAAREASEVSFVARGAALKAIAERGIRLRIEGRMLTAKVRAGDDPGAFGVQDLVIIAVKGPALPQVAARIAPLLGPNTIVLPAMNGLPWWFLEELPGPCSGLRLESVDPGGAVSRAIPIHHVLGCVVHASASVSEPGLIEHNKGHRLIIGEPSGRSTPRLARVAALLSDAGLEVIPSSRIQYDIWYKLWGNLTMNPVSALTGATADRVLDDPLVSRFCRAAMAEASAIGERIGCKVEETPEARHIVTRKLGAFKTSMLQDAESGKPLEIDAIVGAVKEIGEHVGVATPCIDALFGLIRLYGETHGLYERPATGAS